MFWFKVQVVLVQSYLNLKIGLVPVLKAGSSGIFKINYYSFWFNLVLQFKNIKLTNNGIIEVSNKSERLYVRLKF